MEETREVDQGSHGLSEQDDDRPQASLAMSIVIVVLAPCVGYAFMRIAIAFVDDSFVNTFGNGTNAAHSLGLFTAVTVTLFVVALRFAIHSDEEASVVTPALVPPAASLPPLAGPVATPHTLEDPAERAPQPVG